MKNKTKNLVNLILVFFVLIIPMLVSAEGTSLDPNGLPTDPKTLFNNIIIWVMGMVGILAVAMIVWGGIQITTSGGDKDKHGKGIRTLTYALVGLVIVLLSYSIVAIVGNAITSGR